MTPLAASLVAELGSTGTLRFDRFVARCLYDPGHGFYTAAGGAAGRRGDFVTSPEVGPLFGAVLARALDRWWDEAGRPDPFVVVDAGSGPGTLVRALLAAAPACSRAWRLVAVERSAALRERHADLTARGVRSTDTLPEVTGGVVIANELLDNLPFRVLERTSDGWADLAVAAAGGRLVLTVVPAPAADAERASGLAPEVPPGSRIPLLDDARRWVGDVLAARPAHLLVFDYGVRATAAHASVPWTDWVRTYRGHQRAGSPLAAPGEADVTVEIAADQLPPGGRWSTQRERLRAWGIDQLVAEGRQLWSERAAAPDLAALRGRSRIREAEALLDPDGLGGWLVGHWAPAGGPQAAPAAGAR